MHFWRRVFAEFTTFQVYAVVLWTTVKEKHIFSVLWCVEYLVDKRAIDFLDDALLRVWNHKEPIAFKSFSVCQIPKRNSCEFFAFLTVFNCHFKSLIFLNVSIQTGLNSKQWVHIHKEILFCVQREIFASELRLAELINLFFGKLLIFIEAMKWVF